MRAISIDPHNRTVSNVIVPDPNKSLDGLRAYLGCDWIEIVGVAPMVMVLDEEGLLKPPDVQAYWRFAFSTQSHLAGRALIFGRGRNDELTDPWPATTDMVARVVEWLEPPTHEQLTDLCTPRITVLS